MKCAECGYENENDARFCGKCGARLLDESEKKEKESRSNRARKRWTLLLSMIVILLAVSVATVIILKDRQEKQQRQQYQELLEQADKYLEELDYESAEASYLAAIDIEPKDSKPYLQLAEVYLVQEKSEKAKEILEKALEAGASTSADEAGQTGENGNQEIADKLDEINGYVDYAWVVPNEIEADDIYYVRDTDYSDKCINDTKKQYQDEYAIIEKDGLLGLIDMSGTIIGNIEYKDIADFFGTYKLISNEPHYEPLYQSEWSMYALQEGEIIPMDGIGGGIPANEFYYNNGIQNSLEKEGFEWIYLTAPTGSIPIQQCNEDTLHGEDRWIFPSEQENVLYGIYANGAMVTDFIFDECGSCSSSLMAVKKEGKWGFVNEKGEEVIPIDYDSTWSQYEVLPVGSNTFQEFCYAATEGYVVLRKGEEWELRKTTGELAIPSGIFEQIRPMYEGKCWVKKDGKWGVIEVLNENGREENLTEKNLMSQEEFQQFVDGKNVLYYLVEDYDGDGRQEAFGITGDKPDEMNISGNVEIYFVSADNQISVVNPNTYGCFGDSYKEEEYSFVVWEVYAGGSGGRSLIYGVKEGKPHEFLVSGQYMGIHKENGAYLGYVSDYSNGFHDYIESQFFFDTENCELVEQNQ